MIRKFFYTIFFLFLPYFVFSQSTKLEWQEDAFVVVGTDSIPVLGFDEAEYIDGSFLPYYVYSTKITAEEAVNMDFKAHITGLSSSVVSSDNVNEDYLEDNFKVIYHVNAARRRYTFDVIILPLKNASGIISRLEEFNLVIDKTPKVSLRSTVSGDRFPDNSVLAKGDWTKVSVNKTGIYKLTYSQLNSMGVNPDKVSLFTGKPGKLETMITDYTGDLQEIPVYDGGSYILFYGQSQDMWKYNSTTKQFTHVKHTFWNKNNYFITSDVGEMKRINTATAITGTPTATYTTFNDYDALEPEIESIEHSGDDWYSAAIYVGQSYIHNFSFDDVVSETATVAMKIASRTVGSNVYNITKAYVDGDLKENISIPSTSDGSTSMAAYEQVRSYSFIPTGNTIPVEISYTSSQSSAKAWFDYFVINIKRKLNISGNSLLFRTIPTDDEVVSYALTNAKSTSVIWDVTDIHNVQTLPSTLSNSTLTFQSAGNELKQYVAMNKTSSYPSPTIEGEVDNQNLHGIDVPDMVIITDSKFSSAVEELATIRRNEGLDVYITTQDKIFNEFSGGKADVTAIRWFMKMLYDKSTNDKFKYLLLFGDGDVNNRMYEDGSSVIMSYQSNESLNRSSTYVSDDYFGLLDDTDGNGSNIDLYNKVDIGIGRIPVTTLTEAKAVVNKIETYMNHSKPSSWKNAVCLVADDQDHNTHISTANKLAEQIRRDHPALAVKKVFLDAFEQKTLANGYRYPDAKALVDQYINEGVLVWGYTGHGSPTQLSEENIMHLNHVNSYENMANLPVWMTATCDFCPYDHNKEVSSGERVLLNPDGGGVALFTTTRLVYTNSNEIISLSFYNYIFNSDADKKSLRLGDVVRLAKSTVSTGVNKRKFVLIGDPSLQLNKADDRWEVQTDSINGVYVDVFDHHYTDTLQSLSTSSISGFIAKSDGSIDTDFNGIVYPTIYDKITTFNTLLNDADSDPMSFDMWNSVLYRGKADVIDGRFTFSFLLPKDLDYRVGNGRIEYYAISDDIEANGYYEDFLIGGFNDDFEEDIVGPQVDLFINSSSFQSGDVVNPNPLMIANVSDKSGINTSGTSIGHDITVKLNNDPNTIEIINSSFVSDAGDFTKGTVSYSLKDLPEGDHTLMFKIWDMQNNSTTQELKFTVKNNVVPEISSVYCYPNPVQLSQNETVRFVAEHDRPDSRLGVTLNVFNASGALVHYSTEYSYTPSNTIYFDWTPSSSTLRGGLYYYRIVITDNDKVSSGKSEKLVLID